METLDTNFYASFYDDVKTTNKMEVTNHYFSVGRDQNRIKNAREMGALVCEMLNIDPDIYRHMNLSVRMNANLVDDIQKVGSTYQHLFGGLECSEINNIKMHRATHSVDLMVYKNKMNDLWIDLDKSIQFDDAYYIQYYDVPAGAVDRKMLFMHWITTGMFQNQRPNASFILAPNTSVVDNLMQTINAVFCRHNIDYNYVCTKYATTMTAYCSLHKIDYRAFTGAVPTLHMFLFFNTVVQLRLYLNQADEDAQKQQLKDMHNAAIAAIKSRTVKKVQDANRAAYAKQLADATRVDRSLVFPNHPLNKLDKLQLHTITLIKSLSSPSYTNMVRLTRNMDSTVDLSKVIQIAVERIAKQLGLPTSSIDILTLILDVVYNAYLSMRADKKMTKLEYMDFVRTTSIAIASALMPPSKPAEPVPATTDNKVNEEIARNENSKEIIVGKDLTSVAAAAAVTALSAHIIPSLLDVMIKDIDFIIYQKRILKLTRIVNKIKSWFC
jgi:hypothetical protein